MTLIFSIVGTIVVLKFPWFPKVASSQAKPVDDLYLGLMVVSAIIFSGVLSVVLVSVFNFRKKPGQSEDGPPIHGSTKLEIIWTAIPTVIVGVIAIFTTVVLADMEKKQPNTETIVVTGQQFAWSFDYPKGGLVRQGTLHLVKGQPYYVKIKSKDVIHSFWVPEFRVKEDAVPGLTTHTNLTPIRTGEYSLVCAELCGLGHATMRAKVIVEDRASFERWQAQQKTASVQAGG